MCGGGLRCMMGVKYDLAYAAPNAVLLMNFSCPNSLRLISGGLLCFCCLCCSNVMFDSFIREVDRVPYNVDHSFI